jgi:PAS domain S-box-containing protein
MSAHESETELKAEIARLRARVEELERRPPTREEPREGLREQSPATGQTIPYRAILNALPLSLVVYAPDGLLVELNDLSCSMYGTTRELIIGNFNIVKDPESNRQGFADGFKKALAGELTVMAPSSYETPESDLYLGPSRRVWTQATFFPIKDATGAVQFVIAMSHNVTALVDAEAKLRQSVALLKAIIENAPLLIYARDARGRPTLMNRKSAEFFGKEGSDQPDQEPSPCRMPSDVAEAWRANDMEAMAAGAPVTVENRVSMPDGERVYMTHKFALKDEDERTTGVCGMTVDITDRVRAEEKNRKLQAEMLRAKDETLQSISTPLLPIADGVLVAPLVGEMTRERAERLVETLLGGVATQRARVAVLDVTGVPQASMDVIDALLRAARGVRLLGAQIILTGIRPSVAQTLVEIGTDLGGIVTQSTLERGVAYALRARRAQSSIRSAASDGP